MHNTAKTNVIGELALYGVLALSTLFGAGCGGQQKATENFDAYLMPTPKAKVVPIEVVDSYIIDSTLAMRKDYADKLDAQAKELELLKPELLKAKQRAEQLERDNAAISKDAEDKAKRIDEATCKANTYADAIRRYTKELSDEFDVHYPTAVERWQEYLSWKKIGQTFRAHAVLITAANEARQAKRALLAIPDDGVRYPKLAKDTPLVIISQVESEYDAAVAKSANEFNIIEQGHDSPNTNRAQDAKVRLQNAYKTGLEDFWTPEQKEKAREFAKELGLAD